MGVNNRNFDVARASSRDMSYVRAVPSNDGLRAQPAAVNDEPHDIPIAEEDELPEHEDLMDIGKYIFVVEKKPRSNKLVISGNIFSKYLSR